MARTARRRARRAGGNFGVGEAAFQAALADFEEDAVAREEALHAEPETVPIILRSDTPGGIEALEEAAKHFPTDEVRVCLVPSQRSAGNAPVDSAQ